MAIGVVATLKAAEGKEAEFEAIFRGLAEQVRANEPGNKLYQCFRSKKDKGTYVVMEIYESDEALKAHGQSDHFRAAGPKLGGVLGGAPDIHYMEPI
ncbi:MAG: antibiotic biosynthesis monooxygenase [Alphaproteobacteria bacterium]|nr:antibiotic biosynthesis monooxygenase [Alphaproteobacteria bacterium]